MQGADIEGFLPLRYAHFKQITRGRVRQPGCRTPPGFEVLPALKTDSTKCRYKATYWAIRLPPPAATCGVTCAASMPSTRRRSTSPLIHSKEVNHERNSSNGQRRSRRR